MNRNEKRIMAFVFTFVFALAAAGCASSGAKALYRDAYDLYQRNELEKAEEAVSRVIYRDGKFADAYVLRSVINQVNGKPEMALSDLRIAIAIDGNNSVAHYDLGNLYFKMKDYPSALAEYGLCLSAKKDYANAYLNRANTYMMLKDYGKALADFKSFAALSRDQEENIAKLIKLLEKGA